MPWTKIKNEKHVKIGLIILLSLGVLVTRINRFGTDEINPDAVNWHYRSEQFIVGLKSGNFAKTYQHYHPGVTLMWIMGAPIEIARQINPQLRVYNEANFLILHTVAKVSLGITTFTLSLLTLYLLTKLIGFYRGLGITSILLLEPFFSGNMRLLHLDVLMALFAANSLLALLLYVKTKRLRFSLFSGILLGLALLTKSASVIFIPILASLLLITHVKTGQKVKNIFAGLLLFLTGVLVTCFMLFPALWVKPVYTISEIFSESERIGTRRGHTQIILGEETETAPWSYYLLVYIVKTSPLIVLGNAIFVFFLLKKNKFNTLTSNEKLLILACAFLFLPYIVAMSAVSKKIDRYLVPMYFPLSVWAFFGWYLLFKSSGTRRKAVSYLMAGSFLLFSVGGATFTQPYQFAYTSPIFMSSQNANKILAQKPFGIAIPELKEKIFLEYGEYPAIGFIDRKPMSMIYQNSQLYDIRVDGPSQFSLIVLGPNETMPENITESKYIYEKTSSLFVNGLEYYRVYVKKGEKQ